MDITNINTDGFFESMDKIGLDAFEKMYQTYLDNTTLTTLNPKTGVNYTPNELKALTKLCNTNLKLIKKVRTKKGFNEL